MPITCQNFTSYSLPSRNAMPALLCSSARAARARSASAEGDPANCSRGKTSASPIVFLSRSLTRPATKDLLLGQGWVDKHRCRATFSSATPARTTGRRTSRARQGFVSSLHNQLLATFEDRGPPRPTVFRDTSRSSPGSVRAAPGPSAARRPAAARRALAQLAGQRVVPPRARDLRRAGQATGETDDQVRERIVVVRRHAVPHGDHPEWLRGQGGFNLLDIDPENRKELPFFDADRGRAASDRWFSSDPRRPAAAHRKAVPPAAREQAGCSRTAAGYFVARPAGDMEGSWKIVVEELSGAVFGSCRTPRYDPAREDAVRRP